MRARERVIDVEALPSGLQARTDAGTVMRVQACTPEILRVRVARDGKFEEGGLERYGFVRVDWPEVECEVTDGGRRCLLKTSVLEARLGKAQANLEFRANGHSLLAAHGTPWSDETGFGARFGLQEGERFVGFGDQTRDRIEHRGGAARMWIRNVNSYTPIPFFMSSRGYGLFVNSTWRHVYDMGKTSNDWYGLAGPAGQLDYFIIHGPDYATILDRYTDITGKPYIPPLWSFGLWFICHTEADARAMLDDCRQFRDYHIPCDVVGLEPGWMEQNYDFTTDKTWHPERFKIPPYCPNGPHNFLDAARRMGFKPMLWLCCDYDLSSEEERRLARGQGTPETRAETLGEEIVGAFEVDENLRSERRMDTQTKPGEPWFDHLKKFVDQGVELFKQDGANQVLDHPDRKWANGMTDEEMHNLYPLLYSKQMHLGFREHTGRRATCFTASGYAGLQRWTGTWAGDTGGGPKPLASMLNLSMSGHSLMTCDMEVTTKDGIHFGFLQPWSQVNSWNYWRQPWYQGYRLQEIFSEYCRLRYALLPYLYSMAHVAHRTGMPILRAMPLMFPDDEHCYDLLTQYMLGDSLLVSAFSDEVYLPDGEWVDVWTFARHCGPATLKYTPPENRGGGLFVRAGTMLTATPVPFCPPQYVEDSPWAGLSYYVWPGGDSETTLIEDDGTTYAYEEGEVCETHAFWSEKPDRYVCRIDAPVGHTRLLPERRQVELFVALEQAPTGVSLDGEVLQRGAGTGGEGLLWDWSVPSAEEFPFGAWGLTLRTEWDPREPHEIEIVP